MKIKMPKQIQTGHTLGGFKTLLTGSMFYISVIMFLLNTMVVYDVSIKTRYPWIQFWMFFIALMLLVGLFFLFEYVIMIPSNVAFNNRQACLYENPNYEATLEILKILKEQKK